MNVAAKVVKKFGKRRMRGLVGPDAPGWLMFIFRK
jgi:hypothetical protein